MKESAAHCNILLVLCSCLGLVLGYVGRYACVCLICNTWWDISEFYFKVHMYIQFLYIWCYLVLLVYFWFSVWLFLFWQKFVAWLSAIMIPCGGYFCDVSCVMPRMKGVLCAVIWCSFPVMLWILGYVCRCLCHSLGSYLSWSCICGNLPVCISVF
jgi:hypothetical protein